MKFTGYILFHYFKPLFFTEYDECYLMLKCSYILRNSFYIKEKIKHVEKS